MQSADSNQANAIQNYRPACTKCGALTALARIEPSAEPDHDVRTFECPACGNAEQVTIKFR